jgi:hypothetical protein
LTFDMIDHSPGSPAMKLRILKEVLNPYRILRFRRYLLFNSSPVRFNQALNRRKRRWRRSRADREASGSPGSGVNAGLYSDGI